EMSAVRTERRPGTDALESEGFLAGACIPYLHRPVPTWVGDTCGGEAFAVRTERHAQNIVGVSFESETFLAGARIQDLHRPVQTCGSETLAVRTERHAGNNALVSLKRETFAASACIPHLQICGANA